MLRSKIFGSKVQPTEKSEPERNKSFVSVLQDQDIKGIQAYLNQENFDVNQPLEYPEIDPTGSGMKSRQRTPLEIVLRAESVNPEVLRALMDKGVKLELFNKEDYVNLAHALCQRKKLISKYEVIKTLSESEEFVKQLKEKDPRDGSTVLHLLAKDSLNQQAAIEFLVKEQGLNVNERDTQDNNTPLHVVQDIHNAQALTSVGADYRLKNKNQSTPLDMEIENHDLMSSDTIRHRKRISGGLFPISLGVIHRELKNNPHTTYQDIEKIFVENTKEENHPFFLVRNQQNLLGEALKPEEIASSCDQRPRMRLNQLFEMQKATLKYEKDVAAARAAQKSMSVPAHPAKDEKKSLLSRFFHRSSEHQARKDPYAGYTGFNPTGEPSNTPSTQQSASDQDQKAKDRPGPCYAQ